MREKSKYTFFNSNDRTVVQDRLEMSVILHLLSQCTAKMSCEKTDAFRIREKSNFVDQHIPAKVNL